MAVPAHTQSCRNVSGRQPDESYPETRQIKLIPCDFTCTRLPPLISDNEASPSFRRFNTTLDSHSTMFFVSAENSSNSAEIRANLIEF